jgi:hypothetical protein
MITFSGWLRLVEGIEISWHKPSLEEEKDEIIRQAGELRLDPGELVRAFGRGRLIALDDGTWEKMENTNSNASNLSIKDILTWTHRDVRGLLGSFKGGKSLPAPMVLIYKGVPYCVAGNTRLSLARVLGIRPQVLVAEV